MVSVLACALTASAANYTWDTVTGDSAITDGGGTWQVGSGNWHNGTTYDRVWADGNLAIFGTGAAGTAGTVTLGGNISALGITLNSGFSGKYTINLNGKTLTLTASSTAMLTGNSGFGPASIQDSMGGGALSVSSAGALSLTGTGAPLTISAKVTGGQVYVQGAGSLILNNDNNDFTGMFGKQNGGTADFSSIKNSGVPSAAGAGAQVTIGTGGAIKYTGGGDSTDRTLKLQGTGGMTLYSSGSGALIWTGPISSTFTGNRILSIRGSNAGTNELRGNLADNGANVLSLSKIDLGRWILSGTNSYSGGTTLSDGTLVFARTNSMPASGTFAVNGGTTLGIRLGGVDEFTTGSGSGSLAGLLAGLGGQGAPVTYTNNVTLQVDTSNASAGQTNTANMANLGTALALVKEGAGELTLAGTNSYTGSTTVNGGTLRFVNYVDLGDIGSDSIQINNGATLELYSNVGGANRMVLNKKMWTFGSTGGGRINFDKGSNLFQGPWGPHTFVTTGGSQNTITSSNGGYMNMQNAGTITFTVAEGTADVDLLLSAAFSNGYISKNGAGTLSIQGSHSGSFGITINQGMLDVGGSARLNAGTFTAAIVNNGIFRYSSGADQVLSGILSGTGGLLKTGSGMLTLSATNSYTGATSVSNGVLKLTLPEALASDTAVVISTTTDAKMELAYSGTVTVKSLTVNGELLTRNTVYTSAKLPTVLTGGGSLYTLEGIPPKGTIIGFF